MKDAARKKSARRRDQAVKPHSASGPSGGRTSAGTPSSGDQPRSRIAVNNGEFDGEIFPESAYECDPTKDAKTGLMFYHNDSGLVYERDAEIEELVARTEKEKKEAVQGFRSAVGMDQRRSGCAGCGEVFKVNDMDPYFLGKPETAHLIHSEEYCVEYNALSVTGRSARNVFSFQNKHYALAPDLVDTDSNSALLCKKCAMLKPQAHTRFLEFGFGRPEPSLLANPLSELNRLAIQSHILYAVVVKMTNNRGRAESLAIKSHTFASKHDGPSRLSDGLTNGVNMGCLKHFSMVFIGTGDNFKALKKTLSDGTGSYTMPAARMDPAQTGRQLTYLKEVGHPDYCNIVVPPVADLDQIIQGLAKKATDDVIHDESSFTCMPKERWRTRRMDIRFCIMNLGREIVQPQAYEAW